MSGAGCVDARGVAIRFATPRGEVEALTPTDMTLAPGGFTALIGPSGCGKSTLMNAVAGFVAPAAGSLTIDGAPVTGPSPDVGVVFQQYALFPWLTALGNVDFALRRLRLPRAEREARAFEALAEVGLRGQERKYPGQLSGGMKQRVAIARTIVSRPKVLLMDEPFGALDAQTRIAMHELLISVWQAHRATVLFITHDVDEAVVLADEVLVMSAAPGRIVARHALEQPRPRSAARFDDRQLAVRAEILDRLRAEREAAAHPSSSQGALR